MSCDDCQEQLAPYVEELLDAAAIEAIEHHLADCPACRAEEHATRRMQRRLASAGAASKGASLEEGVMGEIRRRQVEVLPSGPEHARRSSRTIAVGIGVAACLAIGIGAALVAWLNRPGQEGGGESPPNSLAVEDLTNGARGGSRFEAALEALLVADVGDAEALNQGMQVCWSAYVSDVGDDSSLQ
jgi:anti-sigma factor RsiW